MQNPLTSISGLIVLIGSLAYIIMKALQGSLTTQDLLALLGIAGGAGLLAARDARTTQPSAEQAPQVNVTVQPSPPAAPEPPKIVEP